MVRWLVVALVLLVVTGGHVFADEAPKPVPETQINAPGGVQGKGTRDSPYVFSLGAKGDLRLATATEKVAWLLDDAPVDTEVLGDGKRLWFPTDSPGVYLAFASWGTTDKPEGAKVWFEIKGPNGPPTPVNAIAAKLKTVLTGPDAKVDASKLAGLCSAIADVIEAGQFKSMGELGSAWKAAQAGSQWPANKYPGMPDVIRMAIPVVDETAGPVLIDNDKRLAFVQNLRVIEKTARSIADAK